MRKRLLDVGVALLFALLFAACGSAGSDEPPRVVKLAPYHTYLVKNAAALVRAVQAMQPELEHRQVSRAQSRFVRGRVRYSQIEPAAETLPRLNVRIDGLPGEGPLTGFHRIERELWQAEDTAGMAAVGRRLIAETKRLREHLASADFSAVQLVAGASRILSEISSVKLTNKEDVYGGADLVDVSGNLEAVGAALAALAPALTAEERQRLRALLHEAYGKIAEYGTPARDPDQSRDRSPGAIFVVFDELSPAEVKEIRRPVSALDRSLAEVQSRLEEAG